MKEPARSPTIICLGEMLYDLISDTPGAAMAEVKSWQPHIGGAPANVAFALAKLTMQVRFLGRIGRDPEGLALGKALENESISVQGVQWDDQAPTRKVYVERSLNGERHFAGFGPFKSSDFADTRLAAHQIPWKMFEGTSAVVLGTLLLAYPGSRDSVLQVVDYCVAHQIPLILDINWRPVFWLKEQEGLEIIHSMITSAEVVKFSKEEAILLYHTDHLGFISERLPRSKAILITDGDKGCHYQIGGFTGFVPAYPVLAVDTTGAGDSFLAGFLYRYFHHPVQEPLSAQSARSMVLFASAMGAITTTGPGAIAPQATLQEVHEFMKTHPVVED